EVSNDPSAFPRSTAPRPADAGRHVRAEFCRARGSRPGTRLPPASLHDADHDALADADNDADHDALADADDDADDDHAGPDADDDVGPDQRAAAARPAPGFPPAPRPPG